MARRWHSRSWCPQLGVEECKPHVPDPRRGLTASSGIRCGAWCARLGQTPWCKIPRTSGSSRQVVRVTLNGDLDDTSSNSLAHMLFSHSLLVSTTCSHGEAELGGTVVSTIGEGLLAFGENPVCRFGTIEVRARSGFERVGEGYRGTSPHALHSMTGAACGLPCSARPPLDMHFAARPLLREPCCAIERLVERRALLDEHLVVALLQLVG